MTTKELKIVLQNLASETVNNIYGKYMVSDMEDAIETTAGWFIVNKRKLEKSFCFGYDGIDQESYDRAQNMVQEATTNQEYFINENLKWYDELLEQLESGDGYFTSLSCDYPNAPFIDIIPAHSAYILEANSNRVNVRHGLLPKEDIKKLIEFVKKLRAKQEKRCNTYIKKYGLKKIHAWSYDRWD